MPDDTAPDVTYTPDSSSLASVLAAPPDNSASLAPASAPTPGPAAPAPTKGPDLFRTLLAAALLGGATGAGGRNAGEGAALGSQAVIQNDQRQFQNQRALSADQRAEQLQGAQIAHINLVNRQAQLSMDHDNIEFADKQSAIGRDYVNRRAQTITGQDISADELQQMGIKNPELITKHLFAQTGHDGNGNPTYTTFNPTADNVKLTDSDIKRFSSAVPGFPSNVAAGQSVTPLSFANWNAQANLTDAVASAKKKADLDQQKEGLDIQGKQIDIKNAPQEAADAHAKNRAGLALTAAQTAEATASASKTRAEAAFDASVNNQTDAFGNGITPPVGGPKEYAKVRASFKKNADNLAQTEQTFRQFGNILSDIDAGKDITGAQSVVGLFNAIGISAEPLKGKGFRINNNTVEEHANARGLGQTLYQKFLGLKNGDVITPQQLKDYATIASNARKDSYITNYNEARAAGINPDFILPKGNGKELDGNTAAIFLELAGGDKSKARAAAQAQGWKL